LPVGALDTRSPYRRRVMDRRGVTIVVCAFCGEPTGVIFDTKSNTIERSSAICRCPITYEEEEETATE
jgi:hypothetical protein